MDKTLMGFEAFNHDKTLNLISYPVFIKDLQGKYINVNNAFVEFTGISKEEIIGKTVFEIAPLELAAVYSSKDAELIKNGEEQVYEFVVKDKNGELRNVIFHKNIYEDSDNNLSAIVGSVIILSENTQMQNIKLGLSNDIYSRIVDKSSQGIIETDLNDNVIVVNKSACEFFNKSSEEIKNKNITGLIPEKYKDKVKEIIKKCKNNGKETIDVSLKNKDDKNIWVSADFIPILNKVDENTGCLITFSDITTRKNEEIKSSEFNKYLVTVMDNIPDIIVIIDADMNVLYINKSGRRYLKLEKHDIIGEKCYKIFEKRGEHKNCLFHEVIKTKKPKHYQRYDEKEDVWLDIRFFPVFNENNEVEIIIEQITNITVRKNTEKVLEDALKRVEDANLIKTEFLSNISHETRTPLNAILGFSQIMLEDKNITPAQKNNLEIIFNSGENLLAMLEDIIELSKFEAGKYVHFLETFNVNELIDNIFKINEYRINKKVKFIRKTGDIENIHSDKKRINQILINLIGNAVKFTEKGEIIVEIKKIDNNYRFSIKDSGIGIENDMLEKIFDDFRKLETGLLRKYEGIGIGLSLCKRIVNSIGGKIWVESKVNEGSTFFFEIPVSEANEQNVFEKDIKERIENEIVIGKTIFIVDDDIASLKYYEVLLTKHGFNVKTFSMPKKLLDYLNKKSCDLFILDIQMPGMDGIECFNHIRAMGKDKPVVAVTAYADEEELMRLKNHGFNNAVAKPVIANDLLNIINAELSVI